VTGRQRREPAVTEAATDKEVCRVALLEKRALATDDALRHSDDRSTRDDRFRRVEADLAQAVVTR